jgi:hypothetical protein
VRAEVLTVILMKGSFFMREALQSSKTLVTIDQSTQQNIPEDLNLLHKNMFSKWTQLCAYSG